MVIRRLAMKRVTMALLFPLIAAAQSGTSTISGTLKDPTGAAVPSAKIRVVDEQTGATQTSASNDTGIFRVGSLLPGSYRLEIEADGFQKLVRGPVTLEVGQIISLDLVLQVGNISETVSV